MIYRVLLLALFASCESAKEAPFVLYESPHGLVVLKAARVDFAAEGEAAAAARAHFATGEDYLDEGRCDAAAVSYLQAAAKRPSPAVWLNAGVALLCDGEYERAGEALAKGLELSKAAAREDVQAALLGNLLQHRERYQRPEWAQAGLFGKPDVVPSSIKHLRDLRNLQMTAYAEIVRGERSLDYFDAFVAEWMERGGAEMTQEAREIYKVREEIYRKVGVVQ